MGYGQNAHSCDPVTHSLRFFLSRLNQTLEVHFPICSSLKGYFVINTGPKRVKNVTYEDIENVLQHSRI